MRKSSITALAAAALLVTGARGLRHHRLGHGRHHGPAGPERGHHAAQVNAAVEWNQALLAIVAAPPVQGAAPATVHPTRNFAILALAVDTAVNAIDHTHQPDSGEPAASPGASAPAAAVTAAHDTLAALYPDHRGDLDTRLAGDLAVIGNDTAAQQGILVGTGRRPDHPGQPGPGRRGHPGPALSGGSGTRPLPAHPARVGGPGVHRLGDR